MTTPRDRPGNAPGDAAGREDAVRRLLADAADPAPLPPEVASRLDTQLLELTADRSAEAEADTARVVPLSSHRRRRVVQALVAAAAVVALVAVGIRVGDVAQPDADIMSAIADGEPERGEASGAQPSADELDDPEELDGAFGAEASPETAMADDAAARSRRATQRRARADLNAALASRPELRSRLTVRRADSRVLSLRTEHLRGELLALRGANLPARPDYEARKVVAPRGFTCAALDLAAGYYLGVRYQHLPALVAYREPVGTTQVVEVLRCGTTEVLRSVTLPVLS
ncbi:hypothetical protein [Nocardioides sp. YIM 152588]|uniref:hypothetical protein n=1 Tax=Nocardioides sp. YIM 152588 TaxID=3158259 RepID=UPI0032E4BAEF